MGSVQEISSEPEFSKALEGASLVVVDFKADWCPPCKRLKPIFEQMAKKYSGATFLSVDIDDCADLASPFGIFALPTFVFFKNKEVVDTHMGSDEHILEAIIKKHYQQPGKKKRQLKKSSSHALSTPSLGSICSTPSSDRPPLMKLAESRSLDRASSENGPERASSVGQSRVPERASEKHRSKKSIDPSLSLPRGPSEQVKPSSTEAAKGPPYPSDRRPSRRGSRPKKTDESN